MTRMKHNILSVFALLAVLSLVLTGCQSAQETANQTNTTVQPEKNYIGTSPEQCQVIRYMCTKGTEPFSDENGCGCQTTAEEMAKRHYPTAEQRTAEACAEVYQPVCGWFNESVQCFAYPCARTFGNACEAGKEATVKYYTDGACPLPSEGVPTDGKIGENTLLSYTYQPKQCQQTPWETWYAEGNVKFVKAPTDAELIIAYFGAKDIEVSGVERVENDRMTCQACDVCDTSYSFTFQARAGDKYALSEQGWSTTSEGPAMETRLVEECQDPRPEACTKEYMPVCGSTGKTYGNKCTACADKAVDTYTLGECSTENQERE